ncbi:MAG: hypothetical protein AAGA96_13575 [Verrucomicrobiota bacterium]
MHTYSGEILALCFSDLSWSRRSYTGAEIDSRLDQIDSDIADYKKQIEKNRSLTSPDSRSLPTYYFNPSHYYTVNGSSDAVSAVLVDDLEAISFISSETAEFQEDINIGYCINFSVGSKKKHLVDASEIFVSPTDAAPLFVFSRVKIDGLLNLGSAVQNQSAIIDALTERLEKSLSEYTQKGSQASCSIEDIESTRFTIVDMLGRDELGIAISTSNFSAAAIMLSALQTLTFGDLFAVSDPFHQYFLREEVIYSALHSYWKKNGFGSEHPVPERVDDTFSGNHVFRATTTIAAFSTSANRSKANGWIEASSVFRFATGHQSEADNKLKKIVADSQIESKPLPPNQSLKLLGSFDSRVNVGTDEVVLTKTEDCLNLHMRFMRELHGDRRSRSVTGMSSEVALPVETEILHGLDQESSARTHLAILHCILPHLQSLLISNNEDAHISLQKLRQIPRRNRIPVVMRRNFEVMFSRFKSAMSDADEFDTIIDLLDAFLALYSIITSTQNSEDPTTQGGLKEEEIEFLSDLFAALHNSMENRLFRVDPEIPLSNLSPIYQGSLTQLILSSDALLKAGAGLIRKYRAPVSANEFDEVVLLTSIGMHPGIRVIPPSNLLPRNYTIATIQIDSGNLLQPSSYLNYLHESFHLLYRESSSRLTSQKVLPQYLQDRFEEAFVHANVFSLLFMESPRPYVNYHLNAIVVSNRLSGRKLSDRCLELIEMLIRIFLGYAIHSKIFEINSSVWSVSRSGLRESFRSISTDFQDFVSDYSSLCCDLLEISRDEEDLFRSISSAIFGEDHRLSQAFLKKEFPSVAQFQRNLWDREAAGVRTGEGTFDLCDLLERAKTAIQTGTPLSRSDEKSKGVRGTFRCTASFGAYLEIFFRSSRHQSMLPRNAEGHVDFDLKTKYSSFMFDPGAASQFCCIPEERLARTKGQASLQKTCLEVSSSIRARRMRGLIDRVDLEDSHRKA